MLCNVGSESLCSPAIVIEYSAMLVASFIPGIHAQRLTQAELKADLQADECPIALCLEFLSGCSIIAISLKAQCDGCVRDAVSWQQASCCVATEPGAWFM